VTLSLQTAVNSEVGTTTFIGKFVDSLILAVVILLVAIPEGLPVTVGISLAYSLNNMYNKDKILVRQLDSNEKMGEVSSFILGKTGTLTTENMTVASFFVEPK
jgi:Ca2+-transporting ATPase